MIDLYKSKDNWVALYRHIENIENPMNESKAMEIVNTVTSSLVPNKYNWLGAIQHGFRSFRGLHDRALVPNSFIFTGDWKFITQA